MTFLYELVVPCLLFFSLISSHASGSDANHITDNPKPLCNSIQFKGILRTSPISSTRVLLQRSSSIFTKKCSTVTAKKESSRVKYLIENCGFHQKPHCWFLSVSHLSP